MPYEGLELMIASMIKIVVAYRQLSK